MPAHNLDPNDPKAIARLLVALVREHGGELRIKAGSYDNMERGVFLFLDFDKLTCEVVVRCSTESGRAIIVSPEAAAWTKPREEMPRERQQIQAQEAVRHRILRSDEELADLEERRQQESALAREASEGRVSPRIRVEQHPSSAGKRSE